MSQNAYIYVDLEDHSEIIQELINCSGVYCYDIGKATVKWKFDFIEAINYFEDHQHWSYVLLTQTNFYRQSEMNSSLPPQDGLTLWFGVYEKRLKNRIVSRKPGPYIKWFSIYYPLALSVKEFVKKADSYFAALWKKRMCLLIETGLLEDLEMETRLMLGGP